MEFDKLKYLINQRIESLKERFGNNFDETSLGLLQAYYDVQKLMAQVEQEEGVIRNAYDPIKDTLYQTGDFYKND